MKNRQTQQYAGQAALIAVIFMLGIMLSAVFGVTALSLKEAQVAGENNRSRNSFFAAEAGIEDAVYRLRNGKALSASYSISLNGATSNINVNTTSPTERNIVSVGNATGATRAIRVNLLTGSVSANFYYGVQVGDGGMTMGGNAQVIGNVYSNFNITGQTGAAVTGSATVAGGISSVPTIQWVSSNTDFAFATAAANRDAGQQFTAVGSGRLNRVSVYLKRVGTPPSNLTLHIASDQGNKPLNTDLASTVIPIINVGTNASWIEVSFASPPNLVDGTNYWIVLDSNANSASNYWVWRLDSGDGYGDPNTTGKYAPDWSDPNANWKKSGGDMMFRVWIGGVNTKIDSIAIGDPTTGTGHANLFMNTTVRGIACPNSYCIVENPPRAELPISDGVIQDWKDDAAAAGICAPPVCNSSGNFSLTNGGTAALGPIKINGNLTLANNSTLIVNGTIYVTGTVNLSNGCIVDLSPSYGPLSGLILSDGNINISNNCAFHGSGNANSYVMLLTSKDDPSNAVMNISNNSQGVIYYAAHGRLSFAQNAAAKEATGYGIDLANNAVITYESGLANVNFASGPSGGWDIQNWHEIVP